MRAFFLNFFLGNGFCDFLFAKFFFGGRRSSEGKRKNSCSKFEGFAPFLLTEGFFGSYLRVACDLLGLMLI